MRITNILLILVAVAAVALSAMNASWIAARSRGRARHRRPSRDRPAGRPRRRRLRRRIRASDQLFIENSVFSMQNAVRFGADAVMIDVQASSDGHAVVFRDADLACRTNGTGRVGEHPLAFLKALDIGYRYTADGHTYPLRGRGQGGMPTVEEVLRALPRSKLIFALADPRAAEALVAAFASAGVAIDDNHGFSGDAATLARLRQLTHGGWILDAAASAACLDGYRRTGWLGIVPDSCRGVTLIVPRRGDGRSGVALSLMDRLQGVGAHFFIAGEPAPDGAIAGLDEADQLDEVPRHAAGMLLIEDMNGVGPRVAAVTTLPSGEGFLNDNARLSPPPMSDRPDYRATVFLPKTDFPMKAGLAEKEPAILARWAAEDLYAQIRKARAGRERFILHDGPPYANGDIHIGHAMMKTIKDFIIRSQSLVGKDAPFIPGWDCHGLPIEWKIEEQYRKQKLDKDEVPPREFRAECRAYAEHWVGVQREQFKRLGVTGDWDDPYRTWTSPRKR